MKYILLLMICAAGASAADCKAQNARNAGNGGNKKVNRENSADWNAQLNHPRHPPITTVPSVPSIPATPIVPVVVINPVQPIVIIPVVNDIKVTVQPLNHSGGGEPPSSHYMCEVHGKYCDGEGYHTHIASPGPRDVNWNRDCNGNIVEFLSNGRYESKELPEQQLKRLKKELAQLKETPEQELARLKAELRVLKALQRK